MSLTRYFFQQNQGWFFHDSVQGTTPAFCKIMVLTEKHNGKTLQNMKIKHLIHLIVIP